MVLGSTPLNERVKRRHCFVQPPKIFEVAPCACGNVDTQWSEFEKHLWCDKCQLDFIPDHFGILDGPIPINLAYSLGIRFDRVVIETGKLEKFNEVTGWD